MAEVLSSEELVEEPSDYGHLRAGTSLGRYELLVPVARGGMARVWAARQRGQRGFQKLVAIKTILPHLAREVEFERMFLDEARIASGVHHPNVCEIYELGEENKVLYMAMEWVSGDSLARLLNPGRAERLEPTIAARIVADACAGAHAAHELEGDQGQKLGVVHRDLSPHNVLLTLDGVGKVCDFGVAKALGQLHDATSAGQLKGKIAYMAPEQITGGEVDRRSDVFSLGCLLYEATTGERPFRGEGDHQVMHAVLKGEYAPPTSIVPGYPVELERIVQRALEKQPVLRYPTAERLRFALEELLARGPLVTQNDVARVLRARLAGPLERRKERIRAAQAATEGPPSSAKNAGDAQQSGVKQAPAASKAPGASPPKAEAARASVMPPALPSGRASVMPPALPSGRASVAPPGLPSGRPGAIPPRPATVPPRARTTEPPPSGKTEPSLAAPKASKPPPVARVSAPPPSKAPPSPSPRATIPPRASVSPPRPSSIAPPRPSAGPQPKSALPLPDVQAKSAAEPLDADDDIESTVVMAAFPSLTPRPPPAFSPSGPYAQAHALTPPPPLIAPAQPWSYAPHSGHGPFVPPSGLSAAPLSRGAPAAYPPLVHYLVAAGVGLGCAVLIGGAGYVFLVREPASPEPKTTTSASAAPAPSGMSAATAEVTVDTVPAGAEILAGGEPLEAGRHALARPKVGGPAVAVTVRAPGHKDRTVFVDYFSPPRLAVTLEAEPAAAQPVATAPQASAPLASASASASASAVPAAQPRVEPARPPAKPSVRSEPALPANPY